MQTLEPATYRETIQHHSKSFSFASTLIPPEVRHHVELLYTWCRHADDAIDLAPPEEQEKALALLRDELEVIYNGVPASGTMLADMQALVRRFQIPRTYPEELLEGMAMDARGVDYDELDTLLLYCYRAAGTVGLMMSHVLGVRDPAALQHAVHLGIAMQLTNICRDVREDWERDRLYIPRTLLRRHGGEALHGLRGQELPAEFRAPLAASVRELLDLADVYYASADLGLRSLSWRAALAVRAARYIYSEIGIALERNEYDVFRGRAYVSRSRKYFLGLKALAVSVTDAPHRAANRFYRAPLSKPLRYPGDVLIMRGEG